MRRTIEILEIWILSLAPPVPWPDLGLAGVQANKQDIFQNLSTSGREAARRCNGSVWMCGEMACIPRRCKIGLGIGTLEACGARGVQGIGG